MAGNGVLDPRIVNFIAIVVTVLWVANFVARILLPDYSPSPAVDAAMTLVLGAALGSQFLRRKDNGASRQLRRKENGG